jgi:hypothetical protein
VGSAVLPALPAPPTPQPGWEAPSSPGMPGSAAKGSSLLPQALYFSAMFFIVAVGSSAGTPEPPEAPAGSGPLAPSLDLPRWAVAPAWLHNKSSSFTTP